MTDFNTEVLLPDGSATARPAMTDTKPDDQEPRVDDRTKRPLRRKPGPNPLNEGWSVQSNFDWRRD